MAGEIGFDRINNNAFFQGASHMNDMMGAIARRRAGEALAKGDRTKALSTLNSEGLLDDATKLQTSFNLSDEQQQTLNSKRNAEQAQMAIDMADALSEVGRVHGRQAIIPAFDQLTPIFKARGIDDAHIKQYRDALAHNPDAFLTGVTRNSKDFLQRYNITSSGNQTSVTDKATGTTTMTRGARDINVPEGSTLIEAPGDSLTITPGAQGQPIQNAPQTVGGSSDGQAFDEVPRPASNGQAFDEKMPGANGVVGNRKPVQSGGQYGGAVQQVESGGDPNARNPDSGAIGAMQTLPSTLANPGYGVQPAKDNTPEEQARVGRDYLTALSQHFGDPVVGLIAYNWGPDKTQRWMDDGADYKKLPQETKDYLVKVAAQKALQVNQSRNRPQPIPNAQPGQQAPQPIPNAQPGQAQLTPLASSGAQVSGGARVIAVGQPKEQWRDPTDAEKAAHPGVRQVNTKNGQMSFAPAGAVGSGRLQPQDATYLNKLRGQVNELTNMSGLMDQFVAINKQHETGGLMATPGAASVAAPFSSPIGQMKTITDRITPAMRNGLPGAASDRDVAMFRGATVGVDKPYATNLAIARAGKAFAARQSNYVSYLEAYAQQHNNLLGAQDGWNKYVEANPLFSTGKNGMPVPRSIQPWQSAFPELKPGASNSAPAAQKRGKYNAQSGEIEWQ